MLRVGQASVSPASDEFSSWRLSCLASRFSLAPFENRVERIFVIYGCAKRRERQKFMCNLETRKLEFLCQANANT